MALSVGKQAGKMHIRVLPNTKHFPRELKKELDKFEKMFSFSVPVDDVRLRKAQVRQSIQRQLDTLDKFKVNADVDAHTKKAREQIEELTKKRSLDLVPELDRVRLERLRANLKRSIESIEPTLKPTVDDDEVRWRVNRLMSEFDKLGKDLHISVISPEQAARIRHRINEIGDELDEMAKDRTVHVDINPFTSWASARLAWLTRPRMVEIIPKVSKAALAKAATALAALSGARLTFDYMDRFLNWISEVDKKLPRLTFGTLGLTTAFSGLMAAVSGVVGLGDGLAATLPSLLLVPGLLAGAVMSGVALFVALKDSKEQLDELGDGYTNLGEIIKDAFWGEARQPIIDFSNSIMPQLERSFDKTSTAIGRFTKKLAGSFQEEFAGGRLEAMFDGLAAGWDELSKGTDAFAGAITNLGLVASRYMPRLAKWFVRQADTFDNWLSDVATDGRLGVWIEEAIDSFYALWDVMAATTGIFSGLWKAAEAAGSKGLRGFADTLMAWDKAVNGTKWQATLTSMFRGAGDAMSGFADGLKRVGDMLYVQRDAIEYFMATAGQSLGDFVGELADAFSSPTVANGLRNFIDGLKQGLEGLNPALTPFSDFVSSLLGFMGTLADNLGGVLGSVGELVLPELEKIFDRIEPKIKPLADSFKTMFEGINWESLGDQVGTLFEGVLDLATELVPLLTKVANFAIDSKVLQNVGDLASDLGVVADNLNDIVDLVSGGALDSGAFSDGSELMESLSGIQKYAGPAGQAVSFLMDTLNELPGAAEAMDTAWAAVPETFENVKKSLSDFASGFTDFFTGLGEQLFEEGRLSIQYLQEGAAEKLQEWSEWWASLPDTILGWVEGAAEWLFPAGTEIVGGLGSGFAAGWEENVSLFFTELPGRVLEFFGSAGQWLVSSGMAVLGGLRSGLEAKWGEVVSFFANLPALIRAFFASASSWLLEHGRQILQGLKTGIEAKWGEVLSFLGTIPSRIIAFFANAGSWLVSSGRALLEGFASGVQQAAEGAAARVAEAVGRIRGLFPSSPAKWGPFSGRGWVSYSGAAVGDTFGASLTDSLIRARRNLAKSMSGIRGEFTSLTDDVSSMSPSFDVAAQYKGYRSHASRINGGNGASTSAAVAAGGTNVVANFMQSNQRDQFREFKAVLDRALR